MSINKVTVQVPNGRRQIVKVSPNTTILQILEEVCTKHGYSSEEYALKHHKRILDPTLMFRFAGLPNNGALEMVEFDNKREETEVVLCLQLENGTRPQKSYKPSENLQNILNELCPDISAPEKHPVAIYMRKEIYGEALSTTTLKSLGITSGRAMIRIINKNPEQLKGQANVYVPPKREESVVTEKPRKTEGKQQPGNFNVLQTIKKLKEETPGKSEAPPVKVEVKEEKVEEKQPIKYEWGTAGNSLDGKVVDNTEEEQSEEVELKDFESQIHVLGERDAVIFSLNDAQKVVDDIPDTFFDLTVRDLQFLLRDLKRQTKEMDDAPLLTSKLREMEENNRILNKLGHYKKSVIRIQFPNRLVLQGTFSPVETIEIVQDFVAKYLKNPDTSFYLFTIPPKKIVDKSKTLVEADCVPTAVLHFGTDETVSDDELLKPEYTNKLTTPNGAVMAASKLRGSCNKRRESSENDAMESMPGPSKGAAPKQLKPDNFKQSSANTKSSTPVPKWFKPTGK